MDPGATGQPIETPCERSRFLTVLLEDEERGRLQPVEHYVAAFPALGDFVREEYSALLSAAPAPSAVLAPGTAVGRYRVVRELGAGGMGTVYEAIDPELARRVVLKSLHPALARDAKARERLRREARLLGSLSHPCLVEVIDVVEQDHALHVVMPFVEGSTLAAHLAADRARSLVDGGVGPVHLQDVTDHGAALRSLLCAFVGLAEALQCAHDAGIVHRDVKPENVLVLPDATARLFDFGLARPDGELRLTSVGEMLGTPLYMAPEQIDGGAATAASDVYALGVMLYEALTLVHPFAGGGGRAATFQRILAGDPVPPRRHHERLSRDLEGVALQNVDVLRAMERQPEQRYRSAAAFARDLRRVLDLEPTEARPVSGITAMWRRLRRRPRATALWTVAVVALVAAAGMAMQWLQQRGKNHSARVLVEDLLAQPAAAAGVPELREIADALRSLGLAGAPGMHLVAPRGRVAAVPVLAWIGVSPTDSALDDAVHNRYRVALCAADGRELWSADHEQANDTRLCALPLPALPRAATSWSVTWCGWREPT